MKYIPVFVTPCSHYSEKYVSSPLRRVLDIDPHLSVEFSLFVVISLVLSPRKQSADREVEEHRADQQPETCHSEGWAGRGDKHSRAAPAYTGM